MPFSNLLLIHPLLGPDDAWSGYLVEAGSRSEVAGESIKHLCAHPGLKDFDKRHPWFLPATTTSSIETPLGDRAVTVFPANPATDSVAALKRLEESLRQARCKVGLAAEPGRPLPGTGAWDYLIITCSHARTLPPFTLHGMSSQTTILATGVHSHADHDWTLANACSLVSTEFLLTRAVPGKKADMTRVKLLEMLSLIAADAPTEEIEAVLRQEPKLSYSLLRLVNSAANAPRSPITSFSQAINLLGRRQLQRWLQLLVYADPNNGQQPNPLLQKAAARGRLMELLASQLAPRPAIEGLEDTAFMVGAFSLLDILLNMSMSEILQQLPLPPAAQAALIDCAGPFGNLLGAIRSADSRDHAGTAKQLKPTGLTAQHWLDSQLSALGWAARIHPAN